MPSLTVHVTEGSNNEKKKNPQKNRQNLLPPPNLQTAFTNLQPERSPTLRQEKTLRNVEFEEKYHQTKPVAKTCPLDFEGDITLLTLTDWHEWVRWHHAKLDVTAHFSDPGAVNCSLFLCVSRTFAFVHGLSLWLAIVHFDCSPLTFGGSDRNWNDNLCFHISKKEDMIEYVYRKHI